MGIHSCPTTTPPREDGSPTHDLPRQLPLCSCPSPGLRFVCHLSPAAPYLDGPSQGFPLCVAGDHRSQHWPGPAPYPHPLHGSGRFLHSPNQPHHQPRQVRGHVPWDSTEQLHPGWGLVLSPPLILGWLLDIHYFSVDFIIKSDNSCRVSSPFKNLISLFYRYHF